MARPGAISCAHKGVLFLDDSTEPQSIRLSREFIPARRHRRSIGVPPSWHNHYADAYYQACSRSWHKITTGYGDEPSDWRPPSSDFMRNRVSPPIGSVVELGRVGDPG